MMTRERYVTKGYLERKKKNHNTDYFGLEKAQNPAFENSQVTMQHRENVWHPYYEIKMEEEDLATVMRKNAKQQNETNAENKEMKELEKKIEDMTKQQSETEKGGAAGTIAAKKKFDVHEILRQKQVEEELEG